MRAQTGGPIAATPTVGGGNVYVGSWDGYEYAYPGKSGSRLWRTYLGRTYDGNCGYGLATLGITSAARLEDHTRTSAAAISAGTRSRRAVACRCGGLARLPMRWGGGYNNWSTSTMFVTTGTRISAQEPYAESVVALDAKRVLHAFRFPAGP